MTQQLEFLAGDVVVQVCVDDHVQLDEGVADAGVRDALSGAARRAKQSFEESVSILGQIASAFSASLVATTPRPSTVEISFGLEASLETGNFLISKVSGKTNFAITMAWKS